MAIEQLDADRGYWRPDTVPSNYVLDRLGVQFARYIVSGISNTAEQVVVIALNSEGTHYLKPVPNTAEEPELSFRVTVNDATEALTDPRDTIIGYLHSHPQGGLPGPSTIDMSRLKPTMFGGVWRLSHRALYWYSSHDVFHSTPIPLKLV